MPIHTECNSLDQFHYFNPGSTDRQLLGPTEIGPRFSNFCWYWSGPSSGYFSWFQPGLVPGSEIFLGSSLISGSLIRTEKWPKVLGLCVPEFSQSIASETQQGYNDVRYGCWRRNMFLASLKCW